MKRIYEHRCRNCGQIFDIYTEYQAKVAVCACGGFADRIFSVPHFHEDIMSDKWVKNRESHMKKERKNMERHGTYD